jgi:hypothetical protein
VSVTTRETIQQLHAAYCQATGFTLTLDMSREQTWYWWQKKGFTTEDLYLVVRYISAQIRQQRRNPGALKFSNLIGQYDLFEEDLAMARAERRAAAGRHHGEKASLLRQTGRATEVQGSTVQSSTVQGSRSAGQIAEKLVSDPAAAQRAFEEFQKTKHSL